MKHIFHIITSLDIGGAERVALNIAKISDEKSKYHIVEIVRGKSDFSESLVKEVSKSGVVLHRGVSLPPKLSIILFPVIFILLYLKWKPYVMHIHTEIPDLSIYLFCKIFPFCYKNTRLIRTIHNNVLWNQWKSIGKHVEYFYQKHAVNVAISESVKNSYQKEWGISEMPIIHNGIEEVAQKEFCGMEKNTVNILFAGRLNYQKGIEQLSQVVSHFKNDRRYKFFIIGSGEYADHLHSLFDNVGNVILKEKVYGLSQYLASFDYMFLPSNFEGLALMPIEASFAKTPCIINSCLGLKDTLPEDWPLKVENNNVDDFIRLFYTLPVRTDRKELGVKAYLFVKEHFSLKTMQMRYKRLYDTEAIGSYE